MDGSTNNDTSPVWDTCLAYIPGFQARSQKLNKEEAIPSPSLFPFPLSSPSLPLRSRTPSPIAARGSEGVLKLSQRVRVEPGRQTHLSHFGLSKTRLVATS